MAVFTCNNGCCILKMKTYERTPMKRTSRVKAGVLVHDPDTDRILIIQSRGNLWGAPKGTVEENESDMDCALRELKEETGLEIGEESLHDVIRVRDRATYFYAVHSEHDPEIQSQIPNNDANAIAWIKPSCLEKCVADGNICVTRHLRHLLYTIFDISLSPPTFKRVERHKRARKGRRNY